MLHKKFLGSLIGGAVGDALGYYIEFDNEKTIKKAYGTGGITEYDLSLSKTAKISDDTQMTLFTANGLIAGFSRNLIANNSEDKTDILSDISNSYQDWYNTQLGSPLINPKCAWIANIPALYDMRAPGGTCLNSCMLGANGTIKNPINDKYGCGGVMRVAPIGLMFNPANGYTINQIDMLGASVAALTHGNPLGYIPAAALVHIINRLTYTSMTILEAVEDSILTINRLFNASHELTKVTQLMQKAIRLANGELKDVSNIHLLGDGWKADEALAIAIYCSLKYSNDFEKAIIASVNHRGDSDSTGSLTGNILGAYLGIQDIPQKFKTNLEFYDLIIDIATDLHKCTKMSADDMISDSIWKQKYIDKIYTA